MAEPRWLAASKALSLIPGAALNQGRAIIRLAAHGLIETRARSISGFARWEPEGGWYYFDDAFWKLLEAKGYSSDWNIGEFRPRRRIGDVSAPMVIIGAQFEEAGLREALDLPPLTPLPPARDGVEAGNRLALRNDGGPPAETAWPETRMAEAMQACGIGNSDRAWREHFKGRVSEHGWNNTMFKSFWSKGRGTQGHVGRPPKNAGKRAD